MKALATKLAAIEADLEKFQKQKTDYESAAQAAVNEAKDPEDKSTLRQIAELRLKSEIASRRIAQLAVEHSGLVKEINAAYALELDRVGSLVSAHEAAESAELKRILKPLFSDETNLADSIRFLLLRTTKAAHRLQAEHDIRVIAIRGNNCTVQEKCQAIEGAVQTLGPK